MDLAGMLEDAIAKRAHADTAWARFVEAARKQRGELRTLRGNRTQDAIARVACVPRPYVSMLEAAHVEHLPYSALQRMLQAYRRGTVDG